MASLQEAYGSNLETLATKYGAIITCTPLRADHVSAADKQPLCFITASGSFSAVDLVHNAMRTASLADPEAKHVPRDKQASITRTLETVGVQSAASLPLHDMGFWRYAIREATSDHVSVQMAVVPDDLAATLTRYGGLEFIERRSGARAELSESVTSTHTRIANVPVASVLLIGSIEQVQLALGLASGMRYARTIETGSKASSHRAHNVSPDARTAHKAPQPVNVTTKTSAEYPFENMKAWESVTRFRSESGIMIELAVPHEAWKRAESKRGRNLADIVKKVGGRISTRRSSDLDATAPTRSLVPVLISGTFAEANELRNVVAGYRIVSGLGEVTAASIGTKQPYRVSHLASRGQMVFKPSNEKTASLGSTDLYNTNIFGKQTGKESCPNLPQEHPSHQSGSTKAVITPENTIQQMRDRLDKLEALLAKVTSDERSDQIKLLAPPEKSSDASVNSDTVSAPGDRSRRAHRSNSNGPASGAANPLDNSHETKAAGQAIASDKAISPHRRELAEAKVDYAKLGSSVKQLMRKLTHPVAVMTTRKSDSQGNVDDYSHLRGVTVSSFNTVTMHPRPLISFNLKTPSRTWDAMQQTQKTCIHILAANPAGAAIAHAFTVAHQNAHEPFVQLRKQGVQVFVHAKSRRRPPELTQRGAVIARIRVDLMLEKSVTLGDHVIVVGEVTGVHEMSSFIGLDERALAYSQQGYRELGKVVRPMMGPDMFAKGEAAGDVAVESTRVEYAQDAVDDVAEQLAVDEAVTPDAAEKDPQTSQDLGPNVFQEDLSRAADDDNTQDHPSKLGNSQSQVAPHDTPTPHKKPGTQKQYITTPISTGVVNDRYFDPDNATAEQQDFPKPTSDPGNAPKEIESTDAATATPIRRVQSSFSSSAFGPRKPIALGDGRPSAEPDLLEGMLMDAERRGAPGPIDGGRGIGHELARSREALPWGVKA
ncbi:hypothetical protein B0A48_12709 [Cryoendolithus antarcticus]|uniref:Flavin reductase like domain-containing protein n=1 Tax=Cryoendolithus antarcticus TaxID=1507870 RepID=A0A1V8SS07_9PEZI|nr:hypothetical protein B0A48_12709 [Cryoendolithus antarcticus]